MERWSQPIGVGSYLIVRDGGLREVAIRLGRGFNVFKIAGQRVTALAAALDAHVAQKGRQTRQAPMQTAQWDRGR